MREPGPRRAAHPVTSALVDRPRLAEVLALVDVGECAVADPACLNAPWTTGRGTTLTLGQKRDLGCLPSWKAEGRRFDPAPDHHPTTDLTSGNAGNPLPLLVLPITVADH